MSLAPPLTLLRAACCLRRVQRDIDRARAQKRNPKQTQNEKDGLTPLQRKERCVSAARHAAAQPLPACGQSSRLATRLPLPPRARARVR